MFRFMAQLLHPKAVLNASYFPAPQIFWDRLVQLGSIQLVLPAIYGAIKRKKLEYNIPKDLIFYLQEITDLNLKRNTAILKQIDFLSELFNRHQIEYVFLKGAAILIIKPYDVLSERMIGDIDILVSEKDLAKAQHLLINEGFKAVPSEFSFTKGVFTDNYHKHLKRISHPNYIAAVEIHRCLLQNGNHLIPPKDVLDNKLQSKQRYWIPSKYYLWKHAILNWQYNDNGMIRNDLAFRTVIDVLYLESKDVLVNVKTASKAIKSFYSLLSLHYSNYKTYYFQKKLVYKWKLKSRFFYKLYSFFIFFNKFIPLIFSRTFLFLCSKLYRQKVLNRPKLLGQRVLNLWKKY